MKIIAITQPGPDKAENEDRVIVGKTVLSSGILQTELPSGLLAVADGVGGNNAGAAAAHFVACSLTKTDQLTPEAIAMTNDALLAESASHPALSGMATTLSAVSISEQIQLFHVGNSRVYALQNGKYLKQLSADDTQVNQLLATGRLSPEEAVTYEKRNVITACMGGGSEAYFKLKVCDITAGRSPAFLLTSDGIHEYVSSDDMEDIFDELGVTVEACERIVAFARWNGSLDDASILVGIM